MVMMFHRGVRVHWLHGWERREQSISIDTLVCKGRVEGREQGREDGGHPVQIVNATRVVQPQRTQQLGLWKGLGANYPVSFPTGNLTYRQISVAQHGQGTGEDTDGQRSVRLDEQITN